VLKAVLPDGIFSKKSNLGKFWKGLAMEDNGIF
jgi:hypothetical protein